MVAHTQECVFSELARKVRFSFFLSLSLLEVRVPGFRVHPSSLTWEREWERERGNGPLGQLYSRAYKMMCTCSELALRLIFSLSVSLSLLELRVPGFRV
jgi:hypothetical protein